MKKTFVKGLLIALLATGGIVTTTKLYSQTETTPTGWNPRQIESGFYNSQGVWVHIGWITCCGAGFSSCTPSGC